MWPPEQLTPIKLPELADWKSNEKSHHVTAPFSDLSLTLSFSLLLKKNCDSFCFLVAYHKLKRIYFVSVGIVLFREWRAVAKRNKDQREYFEVKQQEDFVSFHIYALRLDLINYIAKQY